MTGVSAQKVSDERLLSATGRVRADWHALLDGAGAADWKHPQIARWLAESHGVDGWWAQGITVGYEQARGRRLPGQQADGSFAVSATRTITVPRASVIDSIVANLIGRLGEPASLIPDSKYATARWKVDGETIVAGISEPKSGSTLVSLTRSKMSDGSELSPAKAELREILSRVLR